MKNAKFSISKIIKLLKDMLEDKVLSKSEIFFHNNKAIFYETQIHQLYLSQLHLHHMY
ncbi:MAG: hypothetical protein K2I49_02995 [Ureaplasma sp.]|nr:hypothetical protein [Ureaplasma sp.]